jgi:hypothetical protein
MFRAADAALRQGRLDEALIALRKRFKRLANSPETQGLIYGFPKADAICQEIGARAREGMKRDFEERGSLDNRRTPVDVYIVSRIYETGGHTALIGDLVRAGGQREPHLLCTYTNAGDRGVTDEAVSRTALAPENVETCVETNLLAKLEWLVLRLRSLRPDRVFLLHHPHDVVAVAAVLPDPSMQFLFVHHADDRPSLGVHLAGVTHFDLTPFRYHHCRTWVGVESNSYLPLTCPDQELREIDDRPADARIRRTATSGDARKFSMQYQPGYDQVVACLLDSTGGQHVHIGELSDAMRDQIHHALDEAGLDRSAFHHVNHVDSLWRAMSDLQVDLYMNSFPVPGARASVEVMGSGTPILWHVRSEKSRYEDTHMRYPEALCWTDLDQLRRRLTQANSAWLADQSLSARQQYERFHHPKTWQSAFSGDELQPACSPPSFEGYRAWEQSERFREHWEEYSLLRERIGQPNPMQRQPRKRGVRAAFRRLFS